MFISVLSCFNKFADHGGRQGNTAQALAQCWHPVASSEALGMLYWEMRPTSYYCIAMAIEIASDFTFIFVVADLIVAHNSS